MLTVREFFPTVQGEGSASGTPAVFVRFSGCNLWSGLIGQRGLGQGICSQWCDTDFFGGDKYEPEQLVDAVCQLMDTWEKPTVVLTGGEPLLQLRRKSGEQFCSRLKERGVALHLETNGTMNADVVSEIDHVTVSPKALNAHGKVNDQSGHEKSVAVISGPLFDHIVLRKGQDLKVVYPQWSMIAMVMMNSWEFENRYVQPLDAPSWGPWKGTHLESTELAARLLGWRISVQTHKMVGWA